MKKYIVHVYFSGYTDVMVKAKSESEAVIKGRKEVMKNLEACRPTDLHYLEEIQNVVNSLEPWPQCDTAEEV